MEIPSESVIYRDRRYSKTGKHHAMVYTGYSKDQETQMQITTTQPLVPLYRMLIISTVLALVAVLAYFALPEQKLRIIPKLGNESHLFFDGQKGGPNQAEWINQKEFHFKCNGSSTPADTVYCGLSINFHQLDNGRDYSKFQHMEIKIHYRGDNHRLRLKMHNFKPAQSEGDTHETLQGLEISFLASDTEGVLKIDNHGWAEFENGSTVDMGIDLVPPIAPGVHEVRLEYVDIQGKLLKAETWYLGVAILWLMSNLFFITRHLMLQARRIRNDSQRLSTLVHYSDDLQQKSEHYKILSTTDPLTGALNRNGFAQEMSQRSPTGKLKTHTTLMIIDLDHFKKVNDGYGHDAGDAVLREAAQVIQNSTRSSDRFIRWGGEEFILFCENTNTQQALLIAEKVRASIEAMKINYQQHSIPVTASIGIGVAKQDENFDDLFKRSDDALYKAKNMGRNCVVLAE